MAKKQENLKRAPTLFILEIFDMSCRLISIIVLSVVFFFSFFAPVGQTTAPRINIPVLNTQTLPDMETMAGIGGLTEERYNAMKDMLFGVDYVRRARNATMAEISEKTDAQRRAEEARMRTDTKTSVAFPAFTVEGKGKLGRMRFYSIKTGQVRSSVRFSGGKLVGENPWPDFVVTEELGGIRLSAVSDSSVFKVYQEDSKLAPFLESAKKER